MDAPAIAADECGKTAQALGYPVPCPTVLPRRSLPMGQTCGITQTAYYISPGCATYYRRVEANIGFPSQTRVGHVAIEAASGRRSAGEMINGNALRRDPIGVVRRSHFGSRRSLLVKVPDESSSNSAGHTVLIWYAPYRSLGHVTSVVTLVVSVHGGDPGAEALARALARGIRLARPWT